MKARAPLVLLLAAGALAGCTSTRSAAAPAASLCPRVAIINGLGSLEQPAADGSGEPAYRAALENIDGSCRPDGNDLAVDIAVDVTVQPGPALRNGGRIEVPYFVAVSAPNGDVLDRQDYVAKIDLAPGARRGGVTETFSQRFVGQKQGAAGYQVLFGFTLPQDEALRQRRQNS
ncbi:hypothetical protein [Benzoatithermus flavus]|uniref:Lipoprotein n=1 Tax=Benzoatithermus flavus TaxID=3108223 RepID=A0ABU8XSH9_9PROT